MADFSHLDSTGESRMVDIGWKPATERRATAQGRISLSAECVAKLAALQDFSAVASTARLAGIQACKKTSELVPFCHQIALTFADVKIQLKEQENAVEITAETKSVSGSGVEMEALTAVTTAALTVYDMVKAVDPSAILGPFFVTHKQGGKGGSWCNPNLITDQKI